MPASTAPTDRAESHRTLARAVELGVTHFDTSNVYGAGESEEVIGAFLKDHPVRDRLHIATKGGIKRGPPRSFDNSPEHLRECLEGSLRRLGTDHVDLYYIHRREQVRPIEDVVGTLVRFKEEGKILGIGFSEIAPYSLRRASAVHPIMAVQSEYSLWTRLPDLGMIETCRELGTTFVAFSPVGRGIFSDPLPDPAKFGEGDFRLNNPRFLEPNFAHNAEAVARFNAYARERGHAPASLAIAWTLHRGDNIVPIPGTRSPAHLEENVKAASITLSEADMAEIEKILPTGFAWGDRYSDAQTIGPERYC